MLEPREELFAQAIAAGKGNQAAAIQAGWAASTAKKVAPRLLEREDVQAHILKLRQQIAIAAQVDATRVITQIAKTAFFEADEMWALSKNPDKDWSEYAKAAVSSVKVTRRFKPGNEDVGDEIEVTTEIKVRDTLRALKMLGDYTGAFTELNTAIATLKTYGINVERIDGKWEVVKDASDKATAAT